MSEFKVNARLWQITSCSRSHLIASTMNYRLHCVIVSLVLISASNLWADDFPQPLNTENPDAKLTSPEDALKGMTLPAGFQVTLFAAEPDVHQPIALATDDRGRLWVAENYTYAEACHQLTTIACVTVL